jgi:hypothetical protein
MDRLIVELSANRDRCGGISLISPAGRKIRGPFPVAARASDNLALANGNPQRDPLLRFGDTPTGSYVIRRIVKSGQGTKFSASRFGPHGLIVMEPVSGDAACADANGRFHFLIIGGDLAPDKKLRSTAGSLRLRNDHLRSLIKAVAQRSNLRCEIVEVEQLPQRGSVHVDALCRDDDPIDLPLGVASLLPDRMHEVVLGSTAAALGLMTSFVIAPSAASVKPVVTATTIAQGTATPVSPAAPGAAHHGPYVRLAYETPSPQQPTGGTTGGQSSGPSGIGHDLNQPGSTLQQLQGIQEHPTTGGTQQGVDTQGVTPTGQLPSVPSVPGVPVQTNTSPPPQVQTPPPQVQTPPAPQNQPMTPLQQVIQQQQQINAINAEKPPANATQQQLNQWQQNQQQRIQNVTNPPAQPSTPPAPAKTNTVILDNGPSPPSGSSSSNSGTPK